MMIDKQQREKYNVIREEFENFFYLFYYPSMLSFFFLVINSVTFFIKFYL